jgi:hypothetical protein
MNGIGQIFLTAGEIQRHVALVQWPFLNMQQRREIATKILRARGDWRAGLTAWANPNANEFVVVAG